MHHRNHARNRDASTRSLVAGAGEDWAALSGRPRKANASQYAGEMQLAGTYRQSLGILVVLLMSALHFRDALAASIARSLPAHGRR